MNDGKPGRGRSAAEAVPKVGDVFSGLISHVKPYGFFVRFGPWFGLCHVSAIPSTFNRDLLTNGARVKIAVREIRPDRKLSLTLLDALPIRVPSHHADGLLVADALNYSREIGAAVAKGVTEINRVGIRFRKNTASTRTGHVFEADHTATFNVDAAFQRSSARAERLGLTVRNSADIVIRDKAGNVVQEVGAKVYKTAAETAQAHRGYGDQKRLSPQDQAADVKATASRRAAAERAKARPNRHEVAADFEEVARLTTDRVAHDRVKSQPRTRAASRKMANKAAKGAVTACDLVGKAGERIRQGAKQGGIMGVGLGAGTTAVMSTWRGVHDVRSGKKTVSEVSREVIVDIGKSAIDGGVKGAASGAATTGARVLAERATSASLKRVLSGSAPAVVAISAVELAKHAIDFARGIKTAEEFGRAAQSSARSGVTSFIGAEIGAARHFLMRVVRQHADVPRALVDHHRKGRALQETLQPGSIDRRFRFSHAAILALPLELLA